MYGPGITRLKKAARARNDAERLRLTSLFDESQKVREADPQRSLELVREARALAVQLREPWWILLMDHWRLQCLLHYIREIPPALELAVQATLESASRSTTSCRSAFACTRP